MDLQKWIDFLQVYPAWLKTAAGVWLVAGALLITGLVILRPPSNTATQASNQITDSSPVLHSMVVTGASSSTASVARSLTVVEILDTITALPPLQQSEVAKNYVGLQVEWDGYLKSAEPVYGNSKRARIKLNLRQNQIVDYSIWFAVDLDSKPEFRLLHKESKIRVTGRIESVSVEGISVNVDVNQVVVLERATK